MPRPLSKIRLLRPASTPDWQGYQALRWAILRAPWLPGQSPQIEPQGAAADEEALTKIGAYNLDKATLNSLP